MSRIGKKPIIIPPEVKVEIKDKEVSASGPLGQVKVSLPPKVKIAMKDNVLELSVPKPDDSRQAAFWGLARSLVSNAVLGVKEGFGKTLEISGVGYKAALKGGVLALNIGFSHPVEVKIPAGLNVAVDNNLIKIKGADKQSVGQFAAQIRARRRPDPYKAKGIKYEGEVIRRKAGKAVKEAA